MLIRNSNFILLTGFLLTACSGQTLVNAQQKDDAQPEQVSRVLKEMRETAEQLVAARQADYDHGQINLREVLRARQQLLDVELRCAGSAEERDRVLTQKLELAVRAEQIAEKAMNSGTGTRAELLEVRLARYRIELLLLEN